MALGGGTLDSHDEKFSQSQSRKRDRIIFQLPDFLSWLALSAFRLFNFNGPSQQFLDRIHGKHIPMPPKQTKTSIQQQTTDVFRFFLCEWVKLTSLPSWNGWNNPLSGCKLHGYGLQAWVQSEVPKSCGWGQRKAELSNLTLNPISDIPEKLVEPVVATQRFLVIFTPKIGRNDPTFD